MGFKGNAEMSKKRKLAEKIVKAIMTNGCGTTAERIQLMKKQGDGKELNVGGRCAESVIETIEGLL